VQKTDLTPAKERRGNTLLATSLEWGSAGRGVQVRRRPQVAIAGIAVPCTRRETETTRVRGGKLHALAPRTLGGPAEGKLAARVGDRPVQTGPAKCRSMQFAGCLAGMDGPDWSQSNKKNCSSS
jgi:hypothetical protein